MSEKKIVLSDIDDRMKELNPEVWSRLKEKDYCRIVFIRSDTHRLGEEIYKKRVTGEYSGKDEDIGNYDEVKKINKYIEELCGIGFSEVVALAIIISSPLISNNQ